MLKKLKVGCGPVTFNFKDPDTGFIYKANNSADLVKHIVTYRIQNELEPIEHLDYVLEDFWCGNPLNYHSCNDRPTPRSLRKIVQGGIVLVKNLLFKNFCSQEEADRRAEICNLCPKNICPDESQSRFDMWSTEIMEDSVQERRAKNYEKLNLCEVCSCVLKAKVWVTKANPTSEEKKTLPEFCWQLEK